MQLLQEMTTKYHARNLASRYSCLSVFVLYVVEVYYRTVTLVKQTPFVILTLI